MPKFVEGFADRLIVPAGARDVQVFDDELAGFGIRKFDSGKASYFVKFNVGRQQRRKTLGKVVRGNLKAMRLEASTILAKARLGTDVVAEAKAAAAKSTASLGDVVPRYLAGRKDKLRPKSYTETKRYLEQTWKPLHRRPIDSLSRQDVVSLIDGLGHKVAADRARMALSGLYSWAIERSYASSNPTMNISARAQAKARERVLSEVELVEIWKACRDDDHGHIVKLLILTGQRRAEIGDLCRSEIDRSKRQIELPEARTKNGRPHIVLLSDEALAILKTVQPRQGSELLFGTGAGGFAGWSKAKADLDALRRYEASAPSQCWHGRCTICVEASSRMSVSSGLRSLML